MYYTTIGANRGTKIANKYKNMLFFLNAWIPIVFLNLKYTMLIIYQLENAYLVLLFTLPENIFEI